MEMRKRPEPIKEYAVTDLGNGIINITAPPMRFQQYIVLGNERAMLIDSGFGFDSIKKIVNGITDLPVVLVNTHGHPDHCGGNAEFGMAYLHPADNDLIKSKCSYTSRAREAAHWGVAGAADRLQPDPPETAPLEDGQTFDLGGRVLRVIHTPGHTKGSVCIFDEKSGALFAGDNIQAMATALTEPAAATVSEYLRAMELLKGLPIKAIYTGHVPAMVPPEQINLKIECAKRILSGEKGELFSTPMGSGYLVTVGGTSIHYAPEKGV